MTQNIIIFIILAVCAWFIGRRIYTNLKNSQSGCGCGCSCSDCGPDIVSDCKQTDTNTQPK